MSSGSEIYRNSFSTDLRENDVIFGGEKKLSGAIDEIVAQFSPKVIFVYSTCIVGVIGDDIEAVCKAAEKKYSIRVIPVKSSGFAGNKSMGYKAAGKALISLMGENVIPKSSSFKDVNFLGDFNLAGEMWIITNYLRQIGVNVIAKITGDSRCEEIMRAPEASLNIVQCAGSMTSLAKEMETLYGIPYVKVSFFGLEDIKLSLLRIAETIGDKEILKKARELIFIEELKTQSQLGQYRKRLKGKKAAIYVGGGFKAISLIKQFNDLGIRTVMVGTQTGRADEYEIIRSIADEDTIILEIPVSTPGYGGTHYEGYFAALYSIVRQLANEIVPNGKINVIAGFISPGDIRNIKRILNLFEVNYIFLPDISNTLDAPYINEYNKKPKGGTPVSDIKKMAGAVASIEIGLCVAENISPGKYLEQQFGIPLYRCAVPIGQDRLSNT